MDKETLLPPQWSSFTPPLTLRRARPDTRRSESQGKGSPSAATGCVTQTEMERTHHPVDSFFMEHGFGENIGPQRTLAFKRPIRDVAYCAFFGLCAIDRLAN